CSSRLCLRWLSQVTTRPATRLLSPLYSPASHWLSTDDDRPHSFAAVACDRPSASINPRACSRSSSVLMGTTFSVAAFMLVFTPLVMPATPALHSRLSPLPRAEPSSVQ